MAAFVYYVPQLSGAGPAGANLPEPLRSMFPAGVSISQRGGTAGAQRGPDGDCGLLVSSETAALVYDPDAQDWTDTGLGYWVGVAQMPGPADLERPQMTAGYNVRLDDGNLWHIPAATNVERRAVYEGGRWRYGAALSSAQPLIDAADRIWEIQNARRETEHGTFIVEVDESEAISLAVTALAHNYRVGPFEISMLGLLTSKNIQGIWDAIIDLPALVERMGKMAAPDEDAHG